MLPDVLKRREDAQVIKEKIFFSLCDVLQDENKFEVDADLYCTYFDKILDNNTVERISRIQDKLALECNYVQYKCHIGKGNNSQLV